MLRDPQSNRLYDIPALIAAAYKYAYPNEKAVVSGDFTEGERNAGYQLSALGFEIVPVGGAWSRTEVEAIVRDYFSMLKLESRRVPYIKSAHNATLREMLRTRTKASVELKHQNISAILVQENFPHIPGYKPRFNWQDLLQEVVSGYLRAHEEEMVLIQEGFEAQTKVGLQLKHVEIPPPKATPIKALTLCEPLPKKLDFAARDERNRQLGRNGEQWILEHERAYLTEMGRADLAARVKWVSMESGDGLGYDILSFDSNGQERYIEVKTTNSGALTRFFISSNELRVSRMKGHAFHLYRVFNFSTAPSFFRLSGDLSESFSLEPDSFSARVRG